MPRNVTSLSRQQARRITLAAQGFLDPPHAVPTMRTLVRTVQRTGVLQIDSVNVLQRAHYMPLYSRIGPYEPALLDRAAGRPPRRLVEYWAHVAAFMPVELWPYMRHRMRMYGEDGHPWPGAPTSRELAASLVAELRDGGPRTARELDTGLPQAKTDWGWNWSETKRTLEYLFLSGEVAIAGRNGAFERVYDLPERVLPADVLDRPEPSDDEAHTELVRRAARSLGIATEPDLKFYYRMAAGQTGPAVQRLLESDEIEPVTVEGWKRPAYLHRDARLPRRVDASALLSPFDPVVWWRDRLEALFDFFYRIEIYTPEHRRVHGYYVLPFLLGDRLVARVDLRADRRSGVLEVRSAYGEQSAPPETAERLAAELTRLAGWLALPTVVVHRRGDLAPALAAEVRLVGVGASLR